MKSLNIALCLLILMAIPFAAFSQTYLWEEDFATDPGNWTLQANWSVTSGYLQFYYSPTTTDYNLAATSPVITLPNNAGNLLVTQYINYFSYVDEAFEIAVLVGGETDVLWTHGDGTDWGVEAGSLLELSLIEYQGQDIQLRFRSWGTSTWNINWWRIYHLAIEGSFDDDLSTLSITGPASPSINTTANYTIAVRNNGVNNQSDYTVRLMKEGDVEIASIAGEHITTGQTINYTLPWTPTEAGATYLYGEVILENDEVPANNITDNLNVLVMPEGILVATIGTGEEVNVTTGAAPVNIYFRSIRTQSVYTVAELNAQGLFGSNDLISIAYYVTGAPLYSMPNFRVRVKHTAASDASAHDSGPFDLVYQNPSYMPVAGGWSMIPFSVPFIWNGVDNILIDTTFDLVEPTYNASGQQRIFDSPAGMRFGRSDSINQGDLNTGTIAAYKPQIQMTFQPGDLYENDMAATSISGSPSASVGSPVTYAVTVLNLGTETQNNYTVKLIKTGNIEVASFNATTPLNQYQQTTINLNWIPAEEGMTNIWGRVVLAGDENPINDNTHQIPVMVYPEGTLNIQVGTATTTANTLPLYFYYNNSVSQTIYMDDELTVGGYITHLTYFNSFTENLPSKPVKIWMGNTAQSNLTTNWIPVSQQIAVFDGLVDFPTGQNEVTIELEEPFFYGGGNLVFTVQRPMDTSTYALTNYFYYTATTQYTNRSRNLQSNTVEYDINTLTGGTLTNRVPNTRISFNISEMGSLSGYVYDQATSAPMQGVLVEIADQPLSDLTDTQGFFIFSYIPTGTHNLIASKFGYHDYTAPINITAGENTELTFNMQTLQNVTVSGQIVGSDNPALGLENAIINLTGYQNYSTVSGTNGFFSIPGVYSNHTYNIAVAVEGYSNYLSTVDVGSVDLDLGAIIVDEIAFPPTELIATQSVDETYVDLIWNTPVPVNYYFWDFEDGPADWTTGAISGADHWELGTPAQTNINSAYSGVNTWMTRLSQDYDNSANTWLMSPELNFTSMNEVYFSVWLNMWCEAGFDAMILESSVDGGATWVHVTGDPGFYNSTSTSGPIPPPKWSGRTVGTHGIWTQFQTQIPHLAGESSVFLRFRFGTDSSVIVEGIAVDDVYVGPEPPEQRNIYTSVQDPILQNNRTAHRVLEGFKIYRFDWEDAENEAAWEEIATVTDTTYIDTEWIDVPEGFYRYGVKALHTNEVLSPPAISNWVARDMLVTVFGQVVGSDQPTVGLANVPVTLTGWQNYETITDNDGMFTIPEVYKYRTYQLEVLAEGYTPYVNDIYVDNQDLDLGIIIVGEIAFPPRNVIATQSADDSYVDLIWNTPIPISEYFFDFEDGAPGWTSGAITGADHWQLGTPGQTTINSAYSGVNAWMTRLTQDYDNNANTWLMFPELDLSFLDEPYFSVWLNIWSEAGYDAMILESSTDGGNTWIHVIGEEGFYNNTATWGPLPPPKWAGRVLGVNGIWTQYSTPIPELANESSVYLRFRFATDASVIGEGIALDDVYIGLDPARRSAETFAAKSRNSSLQDMLNNNRILEQFRIYRFLYEDIDNENNWLELGSAADTTYTDLTWDGVATGFYRYAVKAEYTNEVLSAPSISNWVGKDMTTNVIVNITTDVGDSAAGATATLYYQDQDPDGNSPVYVQTATGNIPATATFLNVLRGTYNLQVSKPGYSTYTQSNINIQTITEIAVELEEIPYPPTNLTYMAGNNLVNLNWLAPNPALRNSFADNLTEEGYNELYRKIQEMGFTEKEDISREIEAIIASHSEWNETETTRSHQGASRNNRALLGYNVYRNGTQINDEIVLETTYLDTTVENNVTYVYYVTAVYTMSESVPSNSVSVVPGPNQLIQIGEAETMINNIPFNFFYRNSLSQTIYYADELNIAGVITQIRYYSNFTTNLPNMPIRIWIAETDMNNMSGGWIPSTEMELVFDGNMDFPSGENEIIITLDEFFFYTGNQNLIVMAQRPMDTQYYSSLDRFFYSVTPEHPNRTRYLFSDSIEYDPANPAMGTLTNNFPNIGIYVVTVGMGSLDGHVYDQNDQPLQGARITVAGTDFEAQTNTQGYYLFPFMFEGLQTVTASKFGYYDGVAEDVEIIEYENTTVNFNLSTLPTITVSGRVVGSDQPDVGLDNATITFDGYNYYETSNDAAGLFSLAGVYADHTYTMTVQRSGYATLTQEVAVGNTNLDLGDVVINELSYPPFDVNATINPNNTEANITWVSPDAYEFIDFRYDDGVPVTAIGIATGTNNTILGAVHRRNAILNAVSWYTGGTTAHATVNLFIIGLNPQGLPNSNVILYQANNVPNNHQQWTTYELADELETPNGFMIGLSAVGNLGLTGDDGVGAPYAFQNNTHYYTENYTTGNWSTLESAGITNNFLLRAQGFDLGPVRGMEPLAATSAPDMFSGISLISSASVELLNNSSFSGISNIRHSTPDRTNERVLVGFIIYRLQPGQEQNPASWSELDTVPFEQTNFTDTGLPELINGTYRYAVRSVYTNNVLSIASFSNTIEYQEQIPAISNLQANVEGNDVFLTWQLVGRGRTTRTIDSGEIRHTDSSLRDAERAFLGFKITRNGPVIAEGVMETNYTDAGLAAGTYTYTVIGEYTNGTTNLLETQATVHSSTDDDVTLEPLVTALLGNYPNPFNPETTINYSLENDHRVTIEIYNIRGQHVRTLVDQYQTAGRYSVVWNGKDESGREAGSGIFFYRMKSGTYSSSKKMILMK